MLDLFGFLVGDEIEPAELDVAAPPAGVGGPPGDNVAASLRYADGSLCTLVYSVLGRKSKELGKERVEALWDGKSFVIDDYVRSRSKGHYEELVALAECLSGRGPRPIGWAACVRATELSVRIDAACRGVPPSAQDGET